MRGDSLKKRTISGVKWTTLSTIIIALSELLKISVLARFLDVADFGLMALITFVLGFMNLFMDMGLTSAILHKQSVTKKEYASLYWINVIFSLFLFVIIFISSPAVASFYEETELSILIPLASISIILSALGRQFKTVEQKRLNFKYIAFTDITGAIGGLLVAVILAVKGYGVYALVFGALTKYALSNLIYFIHGIVVQGLLLHFNYVETKPFLKIGIYQVGGQVVNYFNRDLDILLIGKFFGAEILGGYSLAKQLVRRPLQILNPIINKIGVSVFPKFQSDFPKLRRLFRNLFSGIGSLNAFIFGSIAIASHYLVLLLYGSEYLDIVILVQLFTMVTYLRAMGGLVGILVITTGRTDYEFFWNIISTLIIPLAIFIGALYSVEFVIIMLGLVQLILLIPGWYMFYYRLINLNLAPYLLSHLIPFLIGLTIFCLSTINKSNNIYWMILLITLLFISLISYTYYTKTEIGLYIKNYINKYAWF